jgi:threonine synthase
VKALFADKPFNDKYHLGAVNSINWARILAQIVYYFLAYFHVRRQIPHPESSEIQFVVPTGNFGDVLAGYYAKRMGLPMGKLVVATNSNDILTRFWHSGRYEKIDSTLGSTSGKQADGGVQATLSPAMDILVSSNFERLLWYLAYESSNASSDSTRRASAGATVDDWMKSLKSTGRVEVPAGALELAKRDFLAERVPDDQVRYLGVQVTNFNSDPASDASNDKTVLHWKSVIHSRSSYSRGALCRTDCFCQKVRSIQEVTSLRMLSFLRQHAVDRSSRAFYCPPCKIL